MERSERMAGCLLGGAVGDALGAPIEFMSIGEILSKFGNNGIEYYSPAYGKIGAITDDTQMTLFTLEGLLRTNMRLYSKGITSHEGCVLNAYLRWLGTQGTMRDDNDWLYTGWLWQQKALHSRRGPGNTCISSLKQHLSGTQTINNSKGCGGVMRMAPVGFFNEDCFRVGCELAILTHGHPSGYLAAGFLAHLINKLMNGISLEEALQSAKDILIQWPSHIEVLNAVILAQKLAEEKEAIPEAIEELGAGWVAEEALAISLFCAIKANDFAHGVRLAVNHSGDSDSTGAITGNILGAMMGRDKIPSYFLNKLELHDVIEQMIWDVINIEYNDEWWNRYPGC